MNKIKENNGVIEIKTTYETIWFKIISIFFVGVFFYYFFKNGFKLGIAKTCVLWALSVVATPIPIGGILISFPINFFTHFPMAQTQLISSAVALYMLWFWPAKINNFSNLIKSNKYAVYVTCIACSVLISYMLNQAYTGNSIDWISWVGVAVLIGIYVMLLTPRYVWRYIISYKTKN